MPCFQHYLLPSGISHGGRSRENVLYNPNYPRLNPTCLHIYIQSSQRDPLRCVRAAWKAASSLPHMQKPGTTLKLFPVHFYPVSPVLIPLMAIKFPNLLHLIFRLSPRHSILMPRLPRIRRGAALWQQGQNSAFLYVDEFLNS